MDVLAYVRVFALLLAETLVAVAAMISALDAELQLKEEQALPQELKMELLLVLLAEVLVLKAVVLAALDASATAELLVRVAVLEAAKEEIVEKLLLFLQVVLLMFVKELVLLGVAQDAIMIVKALVQAPALLLVDGPLVKETVLALVLEDVLPLQLQLVLVPANAQELVMVIALVVVVQNVLDALLTAKALVE